MANSDGPSPYDRARELLDHAEKMNYAFVYVGPANDEYAEYTSEAGTVLLTQLEPDEVMPILQAMLDNIRTTLS